MHILFLIYTVNSRNATFACKSQLHTSLSEYGSHYTKEIQIRNSNDHCWLSKYIWYFLCKINGLKRWSDLIKQ